MAQECGAALPRRAAIVVASAGAVWASITAIIAARAWGRVIDDFFITFRYAWNFAHGHGFAFNPGEAAFGTTAPGFAVLLAILHGITRISVEGLGTLLTAASVVGLALVVLLELQAERRAVEGLIAGTLLVSSPYIWPQHGSEIPTALLLLSVAARTAKSSPFLAAVAAGLAAWCRPELAVGALGIAALSFRERQSDLRRYLGALVACGLAVAVFDRITMGSFLPITLAAKRAQAIWLPGTFASGLAFWSHSLRSIIDLGFGALTSLVLGLGLAGLPLLWRVPGGACRVLVLQGVVLAIAYPLLGVADYPWYAIPAVVLLTVAATVAAGALVRLTANAGASTRGRWTRVRGGVACAGLLLPLWLVWPARVAEMYERLRPNHHYDLYRRAGEWLRANSDPDASIAYVEVGTIAYFSQRKVHDLLGLVSPAAIPYVATGDMSGAFLADPADYFIFDRNLFGFVNPVMQESWFRASYRRVAHLDALPGGGEQVTIYRRLPGSQLPPKRPPRAK